MRWGAAACLLWAAAVIAPNVLASGKDDHDRARQAVQAGQVLPLPAVLERLQREVPGQVLEVELEQERDRWIYEIKLLTPAGQLTKVKLDARTAEVLRTNPHLSNVHLDWEEPSKVVRLAIDQDKARLLGVSSQDISNLLATSLQGMTVTQFREGTETISVMLRGAESERVHLSLLADLALPVAGGRSVPLAQVARVEHDFEPGVIWRRNRVPTVTVRATLYDGTQPAVVVGQLAADTGRIRADLPGDVEEPIVAKIEIVGGTLSDDRRELLTNFVSPHPPRYFVEKYRTDDLRGGHVIMLGPGNEAAAREALRYLAQTLCLDPTNYNALDRAIVVHGAWYANPDMIAKHGKLGRSQGCFAVGDSVRSQVMAQLGRGSLIYAAKLVV